jgi:uncharacterized protein (DUF2147 family)
MKALYLAVAMVLVCTSADAATREIKFGGRTMRIDIPKNCKKISCMSVSKKEKSGRRSSVVPAAATGAAAAGTAAVAATKAEDKPVAKTEDKPVDVQPAQRDARAEPPQVEERKPVARLSLPSTYVEEPKRTQVAVVTPKEDEPKAEKAANSPLGVWFTEKNAGRVRIQECGTSLCGYVVEKDSSNGKQVLMDMKPSGSRWNGRINDVRSGKIYTSHMSMRGGNALRVEGCAFGGLFCGGETWKRAE